MIYFLENYQLDFWFPPDARRIQADEHFQVRVSAKDKYLVIRDLLDTNMMFRILHNNLDQMVAESIHKVSKDIPGIFMHKSCIRNNVMICKVEADFFGFKVRLKSSINVSKHA